MKFDKGKWLRTDALFPPDDRSKMLNDLTTSYKLVGMKRSEVISLLSKPDFDNFSETREITYQIELHYDMIDPDRGKDLEIYFDKDSVVTRFEVKDWKR